MAAQSPAGGRAERTRQSILEAAEALFAERGFAATRLEDIAEQVGIRRASMVYHFKDKQALYSEVLASLLHGFDAALRETVSIEQEPQARIEAAVGAWVDYVGGRPTSARILLRELADAGRELPKDLLDAALPVIEFVRKTFIEDQRVLDAINEGGNAKFERLHTSTTVVGATLLYIAASPMISLREDFSSVDQAHIERHKQELLRIVRHLLRFEER